jgi:hypothetical protein
MMEKLYAICTKRYTCSRERQKRKKEKKKDSLNKVKMIEKKIVLLMEKCRSTKGKEIRNCEIS